jgi:FlaA1/EpsC-like NDP-sugar epimerase
MICFDVAYLLRFDGVLSEQTTTVMIGSLPIAVASCLVSFSLAGIYRGQWRLISVSDLPSYAIGTFGGVILSLSVVTLVSRFEAGHSRSAFIIFGLLLFLAVVGARLSFRVFDSLIMRNGKALKIDGKKPVLIYGAAKAGKILHEEITSNPEFSERYRAVGFIDDDPNRTGRKLCGIPIKRIEEWGSLHWEETPEIWISSRFIPDKNAQELLQYWRCDITVRRAQLRVECIEEGRSIIQRDRSYPSLANKLERLEITPQTLTNKAP